MIIVNGSGAFCTPLHFSHFVALFCTFLYCITYFALLVHFVALLEKVLKLYILASIHAVESLFLTIRMCLDGLDDVKKLQMERT